MIRIFYIDDHTVTVAGLRTYCRPGRDEMNITASAENMAEALKVNDDAFDIILLDLWLAEGEPLQNLKRLQERFPGKPVVIYTGEQELHWQRKTFDAGVKGFLYKNAGRHLIHETLKRVMNGEVVYSALMIDYKAKRIISGYKDPKYGLTNEQHKIVEFFLDGVPIKVISGLVKKDESTVNRALKAIREKFKVLNNIELMRTLLTLDEFKKKDPD